MCGIAGIWRPDGKDRSDTALAMARTLRHRGPDDQDVWSDPAAGIALSHRRLSIIDLSTAGRQPMVSASGRYVICYNGEVYNFRELRQELDAGGAQFRGDSDTEVVLALIDRCGVDNAIGRLIGMFAFALWDRHERSLILVRDRLGIKPLYWGHVGGAVVFASEPRAFAAVPGFQREIDQTALAAYLRFNYVPAPDCIFKGLNKLEPGTLVRLNGCGEAEASRYWSLRNIAVKGGSEPLALADDEAADRLDELLRDAVGRRMLADVPLGAFLSGGIDSSLVVALMQAQSKRPIKTFTIGFEEQAFNEAEFAKAIAGHLGTEHHELYVSPRDAMDIVPSLPELFDEPFADSSQIPTHLVSRMTRQHVTVALSGDGGDELMAGYTRYRWADMMSRRFGGWPLPLRRAAAGAFSALPDAVWSSAAAMLPARFSKGRLGDRVGRFCSFLEQPDADAIYLRQHTNWTRPEEILAGGAMDTNTVRDPGLKADIPRFISRMQYMDSVGYLPDDILTKVDRASMAVSLEVRVPLLDHRVIDFGWRLPFEQKYRDGNGKWLLRQVLNRYVPSEMYERPKTGFGVPIAEWLRGPMRAWAEELLAPHTLADGGMPGVGAIQGAWRRLLAGHDRFQEPIWGVLMFQAWRLQQVKPPTSEPLKQRLQTGPGQ
jgi:asparagine synthase (glutamine-hydrolysing)